MGSMGNLVNNIQKNIQYLVCMFIHALQDMCAIRGLSDVTICCMLVIFHYVVESLHGFRREPISKALGQFPSRCALCLALRWYS
jgi:hypothetical protein